MLADKQQWDDMIGWRLTTPAVRRANKSSSSCALCDSEPTFYDGLYLGFMGLLSLLMHWVCIDRHARSAR